MRCKLLNPVPDSDFVVLLLAGSDRVIGTMDGNHAFGCTLLGLALTTLLIRIVFMVGPKMAAMRKTRIGLVAATVALSAAGFYLLSLPIDPATAARISEESYRFN